MADLPSFAVYIIVGAIVAEGIALVVLTYLMYRAAERKKRYVEPEEGRTEK